jgi:hypothetical protein
MPMLFGTRFPALSSISQQLSLGFMLNGIQTYSPPTNLTAATVPEKIMVKAFLQRSNPVENNAYKAFRTGDGRLSGKIPTFARSWSVAGVQGGMFDPFNTFNISGQGINQTYAGSQFQTFRDTGAFPITLVGSPSQWRFPNPASDPTGILRFHY